MPVQPEDELSFGGHFDANEVAWETAFEDQTEGYIMIYTSKYKWFPAKWGRWFPKMMKAETYPATVKWKEGESMARLVPLEDGTSITDFIETLEEEE